MKDNPPPVLTLPDAPGWWWYQTSDGERQAVYLSPAMLGSIEGFFGTGCLWQKIPGQPTFSEHAP
jgi:hypothetical protein